MMNNPIYGIGGSLTALATPFREKQVDWKALSLRPSGRSTAGPPRLWSVAAPARLPR
jgi:hypothetical protein